MPESQITSPIRQNAFVIFNPAAGQNNCLLNPTLSHLRKLGVECVEGKTERPGHAKALAESAVKSEQFDVIIAAGGDGTIGEVICGVHDSGIPLGIIPTGTANVLAIEIGLKQNPETIAKTIAYGQLIKIHLGQVNDRIFFLMTSSGYDSRVVKSVSSSIKKVIGKGAYALAGIKEILRAKQSNLKVLVEAIEYEASWVIVSNSKFYGGKFLLAPDTGLSEPGFSVILFNGQGAVGILLDLWTVFIGRTRQSSRVRMVNGGKITVSSQNEVPIQADGDLAGVLPAEISSLPYSLNLIIPER
ncbi:MAG: diacylglycerol/lipid kinase family protein [Nitrospinales bacterium]